jgi:flagellar basal body rod protein FlgG
MNSISTALSGIHAATARLDNAAHNVMIMYTPGFRAPDPPPSTNGAGLDVTLSSTGPAHEEAASNVNLPAQVVELTIAKHSVGAASAVIHAQDAMTKSLLDIPA